MVDGAHERSEIQGDHNDVDSSALMTYYWTHILLCTSIKVGVEGKLHFRHSERYNYLCVFCRDNDTIQERVEAGTETRVLAAHRPKQIGS